LVISKEDKILIESLYETKGYGMRKLLKQFLQRKTGERRFRQLDYVLILFLIVTVNKFLK